MAPVERLSSGHEHLGRLFVSQPLLHFKSVSHPFLYTRYQQMTSVRAHVSLLSPAIDFRKGLESLY